MSIEEFPGCPCLSSAWGIIPHFSSRSILRTVDFYTKKLHFNLGGVDPSPPTSPSGVPSDTEPVFEPNFCSVAIGVPAIRGNIYFFKTDPDDKVFHPSRAMIALGTQAVDEYYETLKKAGEVEIVDEIADKPWGYRQFAIKDPDGNVVQFFRFLEGGNPGPE